MSIGNKNKRIYLDYAATTPVDQRVLRAMEPYFSEKFGNPGSLHSFGQEAIAAVDASREIIARAISAEHDEIIFTGSATEGNNLALRGVIKELRINELTNSQYAIRNPRIIVSSIEHESVLETARDLEKDGAEIIYLPIDKNGVIDLAVLKEALNERTVLVSVMYANNEVGTVQPISAIAEIVQEFRKQKTENRSDGNSTFYFLDSSFYPLLHTDAAQAFQFLDCDANKLGVDLMTLSAHKIYGPKGIGALYVRNLESRILNLETNNKKAPNSSQIPNSKFQILSPVITGGGQEFGLRSGTENVPAIVGFAKAVEIATSDKQQAASRIAGLRDYFWSELRKICLETRMNGVQIANRIAPALSEKKRGEQSEKNNASRFALSALPNILNVYFPNHEAQFLLTKLDMAGVAASSGSACRSRAMESSRVIEAMGYSKERAKRSVRFSFGRPTTKEEVDEALKIIKKCL